MFSLDLSCDIESHLEDLILQSISNTADEQARLEVQQITEILVNRTDQIDHSSYIIVPLVHTSVRFIFSSSALESSVSELVHYFFISYCSSHSPWKAMST